VDDTDPRDGRADASLAVFAWTWVGEAVANVVFWRRPRVAAAGGLAMGAFAVPALRARLGGGRRR
jgi:putative membrane protein